MKPINKILLIGAAGAIIYGLLNKKGAAKTSELPENSESRSDEQTIVNEYNEYNQFNEYNTYEQDASGQPVIVAPTTTEPNVVVKTETIYVPTTTTTTPTVPTTTTAPAADRVSKTTTPTTPTTPIFTTAKTAQQTPSAPTVMPKSTQSESSSAMVSASVKGIDNVERQVLLRPALNRATPAYTANSRIYIRDLTKAKVFTMNNNNLFHLHPEFGFHRVSM